LSARGADRSAEDVEAALDPAQPLSPADAAATPSREERKKRRSTPRTGAEGMGELPGFTWRKACVNPGRCHAAESPGKGKSRRRRKAEGQAGEPPEKGAPGALQRVSNRECDSS
jgi:hypothetical protein